MTYQRQRHTGDKVKFYPTKTVTNDDGGVSKIYDVDNPIWLLGSFSEEENDMATVPGQMGITQLQFYTESLKGVDEFSVAVFGGCTWSVSVPPEKYGGRASHRGVRHYRLHLRKSEIGEPKGGSSWGTSSRTWS